MKSTKITVYLLHLHLSGLVKSVCGDSHTSALVLSNSVDDGGTSFTVLVIYMATIIGTPISLYNV